MGLIDAGGSDMLRAASNLASIHSAHVPANDSGDSVESLDDLKRLYWRRFRTGLPATQTAAFKCDRISKPSRKIGFRLEEISFELRAGEITAVVGRNASGKTTLLRIVLGELRQETGKTEYPTLTVDGRSWMHIKSRISSISQTLTKWHGRLRENLNYVAAMHCVRGRQNRELIDWHIERYGLSDYEDACSDEISGGYKIRFELVRALVSSPKLLVLDEPLAYLDVMARQDLLKNLRSIATSLEAPIPIIITSQHLYEIEAVADQMILLDDGRCLYAGAQDRIVDQAPYRMIELALRAAQPQIAAMLEPAGLQMIDQTIEGYICAFPKETNADAIYHILYGFYGERLVDFRDITSSSRSLFQDKGAARRMKGSARP